VGSSATKVPEAFTTKLPWLALNMACMTWPALRTQLAQYVAAPGAVQRLQEAGIAPLETALPGLTEKLGVVRQGRAFAANRTCMTTEISDQPWDADYPETLRWILNHRRTHVWGAGMKTVWLSLWSGHGRAHGQRRPSV
jgi:hypothetical protein